MITWPLTIRIIRACAQKDTWYICFIVKIVIAMDEWYGGVKRKGNGVLISPTKQEPTGFAEIDEEIVSSITTIKPNNSIIIFMLLKRDIHKKCCRTKWVYCQMACISQSLRYLVPFFSIFGWIHITVKSLYCSINIWLTHFVMFQTLAILKHISQSDITT